MNRRILFFCDGGETYGLGHVTRCAALAQVFLKYGYDIAFAINGDAEIDSFSYENHSAPHTWCDRACGEVCVVDSYAMSEDDASGLWHAAAACLWIDDENLRAYPGGMVVNPSLFADTLGYDNPGVRHLLGTDYIILRPAFGRIDARTIRKRIDELTIIMGGTDAAGLLPVITQRLAEFRCTKNIIGGRTSPRLSAEQIAEVFRRSDLVISAGGQTVYELIQTRTPMVLIEAAANQRNNIRAAVRHGLAVSCAPDDLPTVVSATDYAVRQRMYDAMQAYDFSVGTANIAREFLAFAKE